MVVVVAKFRIRSFKKLHDIETFVQDGANTVAEVFFLFQDNSGAYVLGYQVT